MIASDDFIGMRKYIESLWYNAAVNYHFACSETSLRQTIMISFYIISISIRIRTGRTTSGGGKSIRIG